MIDLPLHAQRDTRWARAWLGNSESLTIGSHGCLLCCMAMMARQTPLVMNAALAAFGGFLTGEDGARLASFDVSKVAPAVQLYGVSGFYSDAVPASALVTLLDHIRSGQPAVVKVDPTPHYPGLQDGEMHFVLAVDVRDGALWVHDPYFGDVAPLAPRYGADDATAIYQWWLYNLV